MSDDGLVAAGYNYSGVDRQAVRWSAGAAQGLGDLSGVHYASDARAISAGGSVVAGTASATFSGNPSFQAFRWQNGVMTGLGTLGSSGGTGLPGSQGWGISGDGSVVVGLTTAPGFQSQQAFRWTNGTMTGLGDLPGGQTYSGACAVSGDGNVVVGVSMSASGSEAFRWTSGSGMLGLSDLPGGDFNSQAMATSADGSVVVGFGHAAAGRRPFRWQNGVMHDIGDVPGGPVECVAYDVNGDGTVIVGGGNTTASSTNTAFIWDAAHGSRNLRNVLVNEFGLNLSGWTLYNAQSISSDGRVIVGNGQNANGATQAWIAVIPEPGCLTLLLLPQILIRRRRGAR